MSTIQKYAGSADINSKPKYVSGAYLLSRKDLVLLPRLEADLLSQEFTWEKNQKMHNSFAPAEMDFYANEDRTEIYATFSLRELTADTLLVQVR